MALGRPETIAVLQSLAHGFETRVCLEGSPIDIQNTSEREDFRRIPFTMLTEALSARDIASAVSLNLRGLHLTETEAIQLGSAIEVSHIRDSIELDLSQNNVGIVGIRSLIRGFIVRRAGGCLQLTPFNEIGLNLSSNALADDRVLMDLNSLIGGNRSPITLHLDLSHNFLGRGQGMAGVRALTSAICSINTRNRNLTLNFSHNQISGNYAAVFFREIAESRSVITMKLLLGDNQIDLAGTTALAGALRSGNLQSGFEIDLSGNRLLSEGFWPITEALRLGNCPENLKIDASANQISTQGAQSFANAIRAGNLPNGLSISLRDNSLGDAGIHAIADALKSTRAPENFSMDLRNTSITDAGTRALAEAAAYQALYYQNDISIRIGMSSNSELDPALIQRLKINHLNEKKEELLNKLQQALCAVNPQTTDSRLNIFLVETIAAVTAVGINASANIESLRNEINQPQLQEQIEAYAAQLQGRADTLSEMHSGKYSKLAMALGAFAGLLMIAAAVTIQITVPVILISLIAASVVSLAGSGYCFFQSRQTVLSHDIDPRFSSSVESLRENIDTVFVPS